MLEFDTKPIGHAAIAIADPGDVYGTYYTLNGRKYYFVETTYAGWDIGEIDEKYSQLYVQIYELYPIPVLGWEQWEYETYGWTMTLDVTVYNDGTAPAEGVRIYAYLDAGGGRCYDDTEATVSLQPGEKRVVTLNLQISGGSVYTRLGFYITHEGISVGESYSDWFNW